MKKRVVATMLIIAMVISLIPSTLLRVSAIASQPVIEVDDVWAAAGSTVEVNVTISGNPGIYGATLTVSWAKGLELIDDESGDVFNGLSYQNPSRYVSSGTNFIWYGTRLREIQDGTVLKLTFKVAEDVEEYSELTIDVSGNALTDVDDNTVSASYVGGSVRVVNYTPGDTDGNDTIDPRDLVALAKFISDNCTTDPDGFNITINVNAADVNDDGELDPRDLVLIAKYISDDCKTDPEGYNVILKPSTPKCTHTMEHIPSKLPTCTEPGDVEYYHCTTCGKYFNDSKGTNEINPFGVVPATGHTTVTHAAQEPTYDSEGWYDWKDCSVCGEVLVEKVMIPKLELETYFIDYRISHNDSYLAQFEAQIRAENPNPETHPVDSSYTLKNLEAPAGYVFEGWYDGFGDSAQKITTIPAGTTGTFQVYAKWSQTRYDITYVVYGTPIEPISDEAYLSYTVNKGLYNLPDGELNNYIFFGWHLEDGTEVTEIPVGTTDDIKLYGYYASERNLAKGVTKLENPFVLEDIDNNVIYFTYELGTIENVPVSDAIWTIQNVAGLTQQVSHTVTTAIGSEQAESIAESIEKATVNSATWTLSSDWNETTEINEAWAEEHGLTQEEAETIAKSRSDSYCVTQASGGSDTTTTTDGTEKLTYDSTNESSGEDVVAESGWHVDGKISGSYSNEGNPASKILGTYEVGIEVGGGYEKSDTVTTYGKKDTHTGSDTTKIDTTVTDNTTTWNNSKTSTQTEEASESKTVSKAISDIITSSKGYGQSYSNGGENSESQEFNYSQSATNDYTTALTYSTAEEKTTTTTYEADGMIEGRYRLVVAGTVHVFGVVGYDISTNSYFTYTFNVMDDEFHEFLDYTPKGSDFDECEYSVLPFEIPYFVNEYINTEVLQTEGLSFTTNSSTHTAKVIGYTGTSEDVMVPSFISSGGISYKVTEISTNAFAGKNLRAVMLGRYIKDIPAGAFRNCANLEEVSGYFTTIGAEAFSGCVKLGTKVVNGVTEMGNFTVSDAVTSIGEDAFAGVPKVTVMALSEENAKRKAWNDSSELWEAWKLDPEKQEKELGEKAQELTKQLIHSVGSIGAENVVLDISETILCDSLDIVIPQIASFEFRGGKRTYSEVKLDSSAKKTTLTRVNIKNQTAIPLTVSSEAVVLDTATVQSASFALKLSKDAVITLIRDSHLISGNGIAVVCRSCTFESVNSGGILGTLEIDGQIYICGNIAGEEYITCDGIRYLSETEYGNYMKGFYTITLDANGGVVSEATKTVVYGNPVGELPVPTRQYYTFDGWYTAADGGTRVTAETVYSYVEDITLYAHWVRNQFTLTFDANGGAVAETSRTVSCGEAFGELPVPTRDYYTFEGWYDAPTGGTQITASTSKEDDENLTVYAHWSHNSVSGWVKAEELPEGAEVTDRKWTYTLTTETESRETSLSGYEQIGSYWVHIGDGAISYASFPSGFDTNHYLYTGCAREPYTPYETETSRRDVTNWWSGYIYWHWMYESGSYTTSCERAISSIPGKQSTGAGTRYDYKYFFAMASSVDCPYLGTGYCCNQNLPSYNCHSIITDTATARDPRCFRFDYYTSYYSDYYKMFQYRKVEELESGTLVEEGNGISNVQAWVKYRER